MNDKPSTKVILQNSLNTWNENHKPRLSYGNAGGRDGLKIVKQGGNSLAYLCTKSQAIEILSFLTSLEFAREETQ